MAPSTLTWAALLARWTEFARGAMALPDAGPGGLLKRSVPSIIALQAVTHALAELHTLPAPERPAALDRAEILIRTHAGAIEGAWRDQRRPEALDELVADARAAFTAARAAFGGPSPTASSG